MNEQVEQLIRQGQNAAQNGNPDMARNYLQTALDLDPNNATAWLWLSGVLDEPTEIRHALQRVLELEPGNIRAEQGLAQIEAQIGAEQPNDPIPVLPEPPVFLGAGTGMLVSPPATAEAEGALSIEELRAQLQPADAPRRGGDPYTFASATPIGIEETANRTALLVSATENDLPYRFAFVALVITLIAGIFFFLLVFTGFL